MKMLRVTYLLPRGEVFYVTAHTVDDADALATRNYGVMWERISVEVVSTTPNGNTTKEQTK